MKCDWLGVASDQLSHKRVAIAAGAAILLVIGCGHQAPAALSPAPSPYAFDVHVSGRGAPMILVPGLMSAATVWDDVVAHYRDRFQVHVLQLPGFAGQPAIGDSAVLARVGADLQRYIREQRLTRPVLVGHSLGGLIVFGVAARAPELVGSVISVDGLPFAAAVQVSGATPAVMRPTADAIRAGYRQLTPEQLEAQMRPALSVMTSNAAFADTLAAWSRRSDAATVGRVLAEALTMDLRLDVAHIRTPVLLVGTFGQAGDSVGRTRTRAAYEAQVAAIPRHHVAMAEHSRHFVMVDDLPWLLATMDTFLAESRN